MANPFLVLGGIAVGIVVATFGVLQVPGWVRSAQDAAALNDLAQASIAQAAAVSISGDALGSLDELDSRPELGISVTPSSGVCTVTSAAGSEWIAASSHENVGTWHARINGGRIAEGGTIAEAVTAAGGAPSGVSLPDAAECDDVEGGAAPPPQAGGEIQAMNGRLTAAAATAGSQVEVLAASAAPDPLALWVHSADGRIRLAETVGTMVELCLTDQRKPPITHQARVTLEQCDITRPQIVDYLGAAPGGPAVPEGASASWTQRPGQFVFRSASNTTRSGWIRVSGNVLWSQTTAGPAELIPAVGVGAGDAGSATHQLVNAAEQRCLTVPFEDAGAAHLASEPCFRDGRTDTGIRWNQRWAWAETGTPQRITVAAPSGERALTARPDGTVHVMVSTDDAAQQWIRSGATGNPRTSHTIRLAGSPDQCLTATPLPTPVPVMEGPWSHMTLAPCDGRAAQKWNVPAS